MPSRRDVRRTYDRIGAHFAETRPGPWPEVESFCAEHHGRVALDLGCGNGRHATLLADRAERVLGVDLSPTMLVTARERVDGAVLLTLGDVTAVPVRTDAVDLAVFVATLHHLPTAAERERALRELARVLAPGAPALVSAWATTHDRFDRDAGFDTTVDWTLPDGTVVERFYHVVDPGEFDELLAGAPLGLERTWTSSGNCYGVVRGR